MRSGNKEDSVLPTWTCAAGRNSSRRHSIADSALYSNADSALCSLAENSSREEASGPDISNAVTSGAGTLCVGTNGEEETDGTSGVQFNDLPVEVFFITSFSY